MTVPPGSRAARRYRGPLLLFLAWALHDVEEAVTFPGTCDRLADRTGIESLRMDARQSWAAVGLMGALVGVACVQGARTEGRSRLYRAVTAGLGAHVATHLAASVASGGYTAGVASALPVMLPGAVAASKELSRDGRALHAKESISGGLLLLSAAAVSHLTVRRAGKHR